MSTSDALKGLSCPRCGGMIQIPEGQSIVVCPFCDMRSVVQGENGIRRYQVPNRIDREKAEAAFRKFLSGSLAVAWSAKREAHLTEVVLMHLPFWATWGRALGWVFGQKEEGDSKHRHLEPREVKVLQEMTWNTAACDVGEFGVNQVGLKNRPLEPFDTETLHRTGMVFEPTNSALDAQQQAERLFEAEVNHKANLDKIGQTFVRILNLRQGLVYYPLWLLRYEYRGRTFQVVVDGFSGEVLYGKAPGNLYFRAAVLVGGMAAGSFLSIDVGFLVLMASDSEDNTLGFALAVLAAGLAIMYFSYHRYRYGEHYEYRKPVEKLGGSSWGGGMPDSMKQVTDVLGKLEIFR